jgi:hypothetical protein
LSSLGCRPEQLFTQVWDDTGGPIGKKEASEPGVPGVVVKLLNRLDNVLISMALADVNDLAKFNPVDPGSYVLKYSIPSGASFMHQWGGKPCQIRSTPNEPNSRCLHFFCFELWSNNVSSLWPF